MNCHHTSFSCQFLWCCWFSIIFIFYIQIPRKLYRFCFHSCLIIERIQRFFKIPCHLSCFLYWHNLIYHVGNFLIVTIILNLCCPIKTVMFYNIYFFFFTIIIQIYIHGFIHFRFRGCCQCGSCNIDNCHGNQETSSNHSFSFFHLIYSPFPRHEAVQSMLSYAVSYAVPMDSSPTDLHIPKVLAARKLLKPY